MGDNNGVILSVPRQHLCDWGKGNKIMAAISSLVSFEWVLNNGRMRKSFYLFHIIVTNRRGLTCCLFYFDGKSCFNKYADKLQKSNWLQLRGMSILYSVFIDVSLLTAKQSESLYGWENQVTEQWCDLPELTLLPQHEEKFCFNPTSCQIHWAPFLMGDQSIVLVQRFSWHLNGGTIQNVICVHLVFPAFSLVWISGPNLLVFIIQTLVRPNLHRQSLHFCFEREIWPISGRIRSPPHLETNYLCKEC